MLKILKSDWIYRHSLGMSQNLTSVGKKIYYISGASKTFKDSIWHLVKV